MLVLLITVGPFPQIIVNNQDVRHTLIIKLTLSDTEKCPLRPPIALATLLAA